MVEGIITIVLLIFGFTKKDPNYIIASGLFAIALNIRFYGKGGDEQ